MRSRHDGVAAYVLGVLEKEDIEAFERHLARCARCQAEMAEFAVFARLLRESAEQGAFAEPVVVERRPCRVTRSLLLVTAGVVVAVAAVLSVIESLSAHVDNPGVGTYYGAVGQQHEQAPVFLGL